MLLFYVAFVAVHAGVLAFQVPSLQDQLLKFPDIGHVLKIPLEIKQGVPTLTFGLGTPPQQVVGVFDTATVVSWVMSNHCNSSVCENETTFDRSKSSSNLAFDYTIKIDYADGSSVRVLPELDKISFPNDITIPRHLVGEAVEVNLGKSVPEGTNGRLGAGDFGAFEKYLADAKGLIDGVGHLIYGVLQRAVADDRTSTGYSASGSPEFKKRDGIHGAFEWVLGSDPAKYTGPLHMMPLMPIGGKVLSPYWKLRLNGIQLIPQEGIPAEDKQQEKHFHGLLSALLPLRLDRSQLSSSSDYGVIDSSTPYLHLPLRLSQALNGKIGAVYDKDEGVYTIDCERIHTEPYWLVLELDNNLDAILPPHQYIIRRNGKCHSGIVDNAPGVDEIHLGGPFFRSFYLEYHTSARRVGIAESVIHNGLLRPHNVDHPTVYANLIDYHLPLLEI